MAHGCDVERPESHHNLSSTNLTAPHEARRAEALTRISTGFAACASFLGIVNLTKRVLESVHNQSLWPYWPPIYELSRPRLAVLWVLVTDDDDPERVWRDEESALAEVKQEGWTVEVGPSTLHAEVADQPNKEARGYVLRRSIH